MYQQQMNFRFGGPLTDSVKKLIIIMVVIFLFQTIIGFIGLDVLFIKLFSISYEGFFQNLFLWQPFTYIFLHGDILHIFFNCFALWIFGCDLEREIGPQRFMSFFLTAGTGAGIIIALMKFISYNYFGMIYPTIGASGAIYAVLLAYAMYWPNREIYILLTFPVKMKYFIITVGLIEFSSTISSIGSPYGRISHIGHLGGLIAGYVLLRFFNGGPSFNISNSISNYFKKKRIQQKKNVIEQRKKAKRIIDKMLDKIAKSGVESLTPEEKRDLEWARRHYYPDNQDTIH